MFLEVIELYCYYGLFVKVLSEEVFFYIEYKFWGWVFVRVSMVKFGVNVIMVFDLLYYEVVYIFNDNVI